MTTTHNGWSVVTTGLATITAGGRSTRVRSGDVATVLAHVAGRFHQTVEPLTTFHGWRSAATNAAAGGIRTSNHLSGTAIDLNGGRHPMGRAGTFTAAQTAAVRAILGNLDGTITWGEDFPALYGSRIDGMHFEIRKGTSAARVGAVAQRLRQGGRPAGEIVRATQAAVRATVDGIWGPDTERRVNLVRSALNRSYPEGVAVTQQVVGTEPDGIWGTRSRTALTETVRALQRAWGTGADGIWGALTEAAWLDARRYWNGR